MPKKAKEKEVKNDIQNNEKLEKSSKVKVSKKTTSATKKTVKSNTSKNMKSNSKTTTKQSTTKKTENKKVSKTRATKLTNKKVENNLKIDFKPNILEYYDLPYRYNKTIIKALAQNPTTLFVYWEISDEDRQDLINKYGENFFYITKPVLVIHNLTNKYSYEIDINDFANNWYIKVDDSKNQYVIELGRKPIEYYPELNTDYLFITSSNVIEAPNDHVLFFKDNDEIYFKNIKTHQYTKTIIKPFLKNVYTIYNELNINKEINGFNFENNPTSNVL